MLAIHTEKNSDSDLIPFELSLAQSKVSPSNRTYLTRPTEPWKIAIKAAKKGDLAVLKIILDPAPISEREIKIQKVYQKYLETKAALERKIEIRQIQTSVLKSHYLKYGRDILLHWHEVESTLNRRLDELLYQFRVADQKMLAQCEVTFIDGVPVKLNQKLRVSLHRKFSEQLSKQFEEENYWIGKIKFEKSLELFKKELLSTKPPPKEAQVKLLQLLLCSLFLTRSELISEYEGLLKDISLLPKQLKQLTKEYSVIKNEINKINLARNYAHAKHVDKKYRLLAAIFESNPMRFLPEKERVHIENITNFQIELTFKDSSTGNNLMHFALEKSQFETARYLIKKGIDYKELNNAGTAAIDVQDINGNTFLHYLVKKDHHKLACDFLSNGANCDLMNQKRESIFDLTGQKQSLIHFLIRKYSSKQKEMDAGLMLHLVSQNFLKLSSLFIKDSQQITAYSLLHKLSPKLKNALLKVFINANLQQNFTSEFQADINFDLWQHFKYLNSIYGMSWFNKVINIVIISQQEIEYQLKFLIILQQKLTEAISLGTDINLQSFITKNLENYHLPDEIYNSYKTHLRRASLVKHSTEDAYLNLVPSQQKTTRFFFLANDFSMRKEVIVEEPPKATNSNPLAPPTPRKSHFFKPPIKKCTDPFNWFESGQSSQKIR
jgi:ankyrin repeat protein